MYVEIFVDFDRELTLYYIESAELGNKELVEKNTPLNDLHDIFELEDDNLGTTVVLDTGISSPRSQFIVESLSVASLMHKQQNKLVTTQADIVSHTVSAFY